VESWTLVFEAKIVPSHGTNRVKVFSDEEELDVYRDDVDSVLRLTMNRNEPNAIRVDYTRTDSGGEWISIGPRVNIHLSISPELFLRLLQMDLTENFITLLMFLPLQKDKNGTSKWHYEHVEWKIEKNEENVVSDIKSFILSIKPHADLPNKKEESLTPSPTPTVVDDVTLFQGMKRLLGIFPGR
jgi:hypothetical protein